MHLYSTFRNGYYDDSGIWRRTKFCFRSCGDRCDCGPPYGYYNKDHDKSKVKQEPKLCEKCGGMIFPDNVAVGWGGKLCICHLTKQKP